MIVFSNLFYHLRENGIPVSMNEWLSLIDALDQGLAHSSLLEFYYLSRAVLVTSEADYDKFDLAFSAYFEEIDQKPMLSDELLGYLDDAVVQQDYDKDEVDARTSLDHKELEELLDKRLREQVGAHNGGKKWIGTGGTSPVGNSGYAASGIRAGGQGERKSAMRVASGRGYKDFREDGTINIRQYQMAFRRLRQMSSKNLSTEKELDMEATIRKTGDSAGLLNIQYKKPRKNSVKLLLLFDSGGSMEPYAAMCNQLFQAVSRANHFSQLKIYYFHNCPYNRIYKTPACTYQDSIDTQWLLDNISSDYKVIFVGDASMAMWEMRYYTGGREGRPGDQMSGLAWLQKIVKKYSHSIWFNPIPKEDWSASRGGESIEYIGSQVPMFQLSVEGMEQGIRYLIAAR